jgi:hypothetical protein
MFKLIIDGNLEWLYEGPNAVKRAKFAAKLMLRRLGLKTAYIMPYGGMQGETIIVGL